MAVLRQAIGLSQQELADLVGRSKATIQAVELGKLRLSHELAGLLEFKTGADSRWLLKGDPKLPATGLDGLPLTREVFLNHRLDRAGQERNPVQSLLITQRLFSNALGLLTEACLYAYATGELEWLTSQLREGSRELDRAVTEQSPLLMPAAIRQVREAAERVTAHPIHVKSLGGSKIEFGINCKPILDAYEEALFKLFLERARGASIKQLKEAVAAGTSALTPEQGAAHTK